MADWRRPGGWSAAGLDTAAPGGRPHAGRCQQWQPGGDILTDLTGQGVVQCQPGVVLLTIDKVPAITLTWQAGAETTTIVPFFSLLKGG